MTDFIEDFKRRLTKEEEASGLSEQSFAKKLGVNLTTYRAMKKGGKQGPYLATVIKMTQAVGKEWVDYLIFGADKPPGPKNSATLPAIKRAHRPLDLTPPSPEVAQDVGMAWSVLESGTSTAEALRLNVHELYEKVFGKEKPQKKENAGGEK